MRRLPLTLAGFTILVTATACSASSDSTDHSAHEGHGISASSSATSQAASSPASGTPSASQGGREHGQEHMHAMDGGPVPEGIVAAEKPTYPVGTEVTLTTDHMAGMKGAPATVVGAYDTVTYAVDYTPTDGGPKVADHKWVVQEELKGLGSERLADGTEVTIEADHMPGMKGAQGTIASATTQSVYMVDYEADGMTMKNHKWVVEDEMAPRR
ncbi:YdhK family protein [Kocuria sp.]|uniref:YdhK family protein n=1 Tax=Kocuria sp. TaxID=1871328 RepID=UPI0026DBF2A3|nr:YdhK family protein [Kocuria sp.]MDO4919078.1 YdhK family protein [Kocuria sp.]